MADRVIDKEILTSFHPDMALFHNFCVNLPSQLCGILKYASAQLLDFLELVKNGSFLNWKLTSAGFSLMDGH